MQTEIDNAPKDEESKEEELSEAVLKPSLKPDGQYRDSKGRRIFVDSLKPVGGVNVLSEEQAELEDEDEEDREEKTIRQAKILKAREAKIKKDNDKRNQFDGLVHKNGQRFDEEGVEVAGVNARMQKGKGHKKHAVHKDINSEDIGQSESFNEAISRQDEIQDAIEESREY